MGLVPFDPFIQRTYSSVFMKFFALKPGIGGVQAGIFLHLGGPASSISRAFCFNWEFLGNILMACFCSRNLQARSWFSALCRVNLPIVYFLTISFLRAVSSSSAGGGLILLASRDARIISKSRGRPVSVLDFFGFFLTFLTACFGPSSLKHRPTTAQRKVGLLVTDSEDLPVANTDNIMEKLTWLVVMERGTFVYTVRTGSRMMQCCWLRDCWLYRSE